MRLGRAISTGPRWRCLFAADRLDHLDCMVLPALREGATVISDRYDLSSLAYQSATAPAGERVSAVDTRDQSLVRCGPDLTIVLDVSAETAEERRRARGSAEEMFESREIQHKLAAIYRSTRNSCRATAWSMSRVKAEIEIVA